MHWVIKYGSAAVGRAPASDQRLGDGWLPAKVANPTKRCEAAVVWTACISGKHAALVQLTLNQRVEGSSPSTPTKKSKS